MDEGEGREEYWSTKWGDNRHVLILSRREKRKGKGTPKPKETKSAKIFEGKTQSLDMDSKKGCDTDCAN